MTECPVFIAFGAVETIWQEIDRLVRNIPEAFAPAGLILKQKSDDAPCDDWASSRIGYHFEMSAKLSRQRRARQFLLMFDMWRPVTESGWPYARRALFTFGYSPYFDEGWDVEDIAIGEDGRLLCKETDANCVSHAGGRLLEWNDGGSTWHERAWLFSVPLMKLDGHAAFHREIVEPVVALLKLGKNPNEALEGTSAVNLSY